MFIQSLKYAITNLNCNTKVLVNKFGTENVNGLHYFIVWWMNQFLFICQCEHSHNIHVCL